MLYSSILLTSTSAAYQNCTQHPSKTHSAAEHAILTIINDPLDCNNIYLNTNWHLITSLDLFYSITHYCCHLDDCHPWSDWGFFPSAITNALFITASTSTVHQNHMTPGNTRKTHLTVERTKLTVITCQLDCNNIYLIAYNGHQIVSLDLYHLVICYHYNHDDLDGLRFLCFCDNQYIIHHHFCLIFPIFLIIFII